jgi:hypothetical protein
MRSAISIVALLLAGILAGHGEGIESSDVLLEALKNRRAKLVEEGLTDRQPRVVDLDRVIASLEQELQRREQAVSKEEQDRLFQADIFGVAHQAVGFFVGIKAQRDEASAKAADEHVYSAVTARDVRKDILAIYPADAGVLVVIRKEAVDDLVLLLSKGGFVFGQEYGNPAHLYKKHCANGEPQIGDGQKQLTSPPD